MRSDAELEALLCDLESDLVERTESLSDSSKEKIYQAICAFCNDLPNNNAPGVVFIGIRDNGTPSGLPITGELLLTLAQMRSDGKIQPLPEMEVQRRVLRGTPIAVVEVKPASHPPVRLGGVTWIRVGPSRAIASHAEETRLLEKRVSAAQTFDQRPCFEASLKDLNMAFFREEYLPRVVSPEVLEENNRTKEEQLASLRLFDPRHRVPTFGGVLVAGVDPRHFLPGSFVQVVRLGGVEIADPIADHKTIQGSLPTQLRQLDELLPLHIAVPRQEAGGLRHEDRPAYPYQAVREIVWNALMHRNYESTNPVRILWFDDRIEIQSPGGPYGDVTKSNFGTRTSYRNPVVAEAMKALGYVERFGFGLTRAKQALARNNNPDAEFEVDETYVMVTLRRSR